MECIIGKYTANYCKYYYNTLMLKCFTNFTNCSLNTWFYKYSTNPNQLKWSLIIVNEKRINSDEFKLQNKV